MAKRKRLEPVHSRNFEALPFALRSATPTWLIRSTGGVFTLIHCDVGALERAQVVKIVEILELSYAAGGAETARAIRNALQLPTEDLDR